MLVDDLGMSDPRCQRAHAWRRADLEGVCDHRDAWEHGAVFRASRYPTYWTYNLVTVEGDPGMSATQLIAFADDALGDLNHRRIDFADAEPAAPLRGDFEAAGWRPMRLVWMRHEHEPQLDSAISVAEVPYRAVRELRIAWHAEDFPGSELGQNLEDSREVAERRDARVLAVLEGGVPVGFSQLEHEGDGAEISEVFVHPAYRGRGIGTAVTLAAIAAGAGSADLWIEADDEDRAKQLYERLGFRPVWTMMEFLRLPKRL